jgi:hypothetical protein
MATRSRGKLLFISPFHLSFSRKIGLCALWLIASMGLLAFQDDQTRYFNSVNAAINHLINQCGALPKKPIIFSGNMTLAYGTAVRFVPVPVLLRYADALKEAGCRRIDFNPGLTSLSDPAVADKYDALVRHIRELGLQLAINPEYMRGEAPIGSFRDYQALALKASSDLAARYKPDIIVVMHEPTTMAARMGLSIAPADWSQFLAAAAQAVKRASPRTRAGTGAFSRELDFFRNFAGLPDLDLLTLDIYSADPQVLQACSQMIGMAHAAHKPVYIEETWRPHFITGRLPPDWQAGSLEQYSPKGVGNAIFAPLDSAWLQAISLFAATHGMEAVTVFRTTSFFRYVTSGPDQGNSPEYLRQVMQAIEAGRRTQTSRLSSSSPARSAPYRKRLVRFVVAPRRTL